MVIDFGAVILLIIVHWIADFILQDSEWAISKSHDIKSLLLHTFTYSVFVFISLVNYIWMTTDAVSTIKIGLFVLITFVTHTIIDYFSSNKLKKMYKKGQFGGHVPNWGLYTVIGLDQTLHFIQLMTTYYLIF